MQIDYWHTLAAVSAGAAAAAASTLPDPPSGWGWVIGAALFGAWINVLLSWRRSTNPLDAVIAGSLSAFAGIVLAPVIAGWLRPILPGIEAAGAVTVAGASSLFGAVLIERALARIEAGRSEAQDD